MKFHWGWGIAIFYSLFVLSFILILVYSFGQDNSLVVEDYYQQDITYQQRMDKRDNYLGLAEKVTHTYDPSAAMVVLSFPSSMSSINGTVQFYRPSSAKQDYLVNLDVDSLKQQVIPKQGRSIACRPLNQAGMWCLPRKRLIVWLAPI